MRAFESFYLTLQSVILMKIWTIRGDKLRSSELQALADQCKEGAVVRQKSSKKRRNEPESCDLESERKPKEKKTKKMDLTGK